MSPAVFANVPAKGDVTGHWDTTIRVWLSGDAECRATVRLGSSCRAVPRPPLKPRHAGPAHRTVPHGACGRGL